MSQSAVLPAQAEHKATVIWFHGLGDVGESWAEGLKEIRHPNVKYVCPTAPTRRISFQMGFPMTAWYDIYGLSPNAKEDEEGIAEATQQAHKLIDAEVAAGMPSEKIFIGGYSMGGALAINVGIRYPHKLAGIISLSGFLLRRNELPGNFTANLATPFLLGHGTSDEIVPFSFGQLTQQVISKLATNVTFKAYNGMGHSTCSQEMAEVKNFISSRV